MVLELKDAFQLNGNVQPDIAVCVHMININYGKSKELLDACQPLAEYSWLIEQIRINNETMAIEPSVTKALDDMPETFTIKELLMDNRAEVTQMCITEYNEAKTIELFFKEGREEGRAEGSEKTLIEALVNIIKSLNLSLDNAMDAIGVAANEREKYAALIKSAMQR